MIVHVVLPNDIDDPRAPSGGNVYDRRICQGLEAAGWTVREQTVPGGWPHPDAADRSALSGLLSALPDDAVVLLDGLVASAVPDVLVPQAGRLRLVILVHLPLAELPSATAVRPGEDAAAVRRREGEALAAAGTVITTSEWSRRRLLDLYPLPAGRVRVAPPGVDPAPLVPGSPGGSALLCVAAVTPHKGHDVLAAALSEVADRSWTCACVGSVERDPDFADEIRRQVDRSGLTGRLRLTGPHTGDALDAAYGAADLLVLPSRGETYGMVVTEALARGIPVIGTAANGLPEALGRAPDGSLPGLLVPPGDPAALACAVWSWLDDADLRRRLRRSARARRNTLTGWDVTTGLVARALDSTPATCAGPA